MPPSDHSIAKTLPASAKIATLHALVTKSKNLAHQLNYTPAIIIYAFFCAPFLTPTSFLARTLSALIARVFRSYDFDLESTNKFTFLSIAPLIMYLTYKLFSLLVIGLDYLFPKGIFLVLEDTSYQLTQKLSTQSEVVMQTKLLKECIEMQVFCQNTIRKIFLTVDLIINPLIDVIITTYLLERPFHFDLSRYNLRFPALGPRITYQRSFIPEHSATGLILSDLQGVHTLNALYCLWDNYHTAGQLEKYARRLQSLTGQNKWTYTPSQEKNGALFSLTIKSAEVSATPYIKISKLLYFTELQRIFLQANIPVYCIGEQEIYVGFSSKDMTTLKEKFLTRLKTLACYEKESVIIFDYLNKLAQEIDETLSWDRYTSYNEQQTEIYYFLDGACIPLPIKETLLAALESSTPEAKKNIFVEDAIIKIKHSNPDALDQNTLRKSCQQLSQARHHFFLASQKPSAASAASHDVSTQHAKLTRRKIEAAAETAEPSVLLPVAPKCFVYPETIFFAKAGRKRVYNKTVGSADFDIVFPLHVCFLPEGKAYGTVHPAVFAWAATYVSRAQIISCLESGHVHGAKAADKTKTGGHGIKIAADNPEYQDVEGKTHTSSYIIKIDNVRIFGHKSETVKAKNETYELYQFDGPAYGH